MVVHLVAKNRSGCAGTGKVNNAGGHEIVRKTRQGVKNKRHRANTQHVGNFVHARDGNLRKLRSEVDVLVVNGNPNTTVRLRDADEWRRPWRRRMLDKTSRKVRVQDDVDSQWKGRG